MSGPSYPRPAEPPFDPWTTIISQYSNSPTLDAMIVAFNDAVDPTESIGNFYDMIWNINTAEGYGLDVWGRIVGVTRTLFIPGGLVYFGFEEAVSWTSFGFGIFNSGGQISNNFLLSDADFRVLILAKAASNISDGSIPGINRILLALFPGRGDAYVADGQNMTLTYTFAFTLTAVELAIIDQKPGILPNPVGVQVLIIQP